MGEGIEEGSWEVIGSPNKDTLQPLGAAPFDQGLQVEEIIHINFSSHGLTLGISLSYSLKLNLKAEFDSFLGAVPELEK